MWCWFFHSAPRQTYIHMYTHHVPPPLQRRVSPARSRRRTSSRSRRSKLGLSPTLESLSNRILAARGRRLTKPTIFCTKFTTCPPYPRCPPFRRYTRMNNGTAFRDEHLLRLSETLEFVRHCLRVDMVGSRERLYQHLTLRLRYMLHFGSGRGFALMWRMSLF